MSDTVWVAIISAGVSLLLVFANAYAKRLSKSQTESPGTAAGIDDHTITDLTRANRSMGEQLHDETRALIRRCFNDLNDRLDVMERARRLDMNEWRSTMKPGAFAPLVDAIDRADEKR